MVESSSFAVELAVNGLLIDQFKEVRVEHGLDSFAAGFAASYVESSLSDPFLMVEGDEVEVRIDGVPVVTGYIDAPSAEYDPKTDRATVQGRSKAGDLVDCSAIYKTGHWTQVPLVDIANNLVKPFKLHASATVSTGKPLKSFTLEAAESVHSALERLAKYRGVLCTSDRAGNVVFTRAGQRRTKTVLERGVNVLSGWRNHSWERRFSEYTVKGPKASATAKDSHVTRHRPLIISLEEGDPELKRRVEWERNKRAGESKGYVYQVPGWTCAEGLWEPNTIVPVVDPRFRLEAELLLMRVQFVRDDQGTVAELELVPPEAFETKELPAKTKKRQSKEAW